MNQVDPGDPSRRRKTFWYLGKFQLFALIVAAALIAAGVQQGSGTSTANLIPVTLSFFILAGVAQGRVIFRPSEVVVCWRYRRQVIPISEIVKIDYRPVPRSPSWHARQGVPILRLADGSEYRIWAFLGRPNLASTGPFVRLPRWCSIYRTIEEMEVYLGIAHNQPGTPV